MKLWDKNISTEDKILSFTTGMDPVFDLELAPYDVMGSMAHAIMLAEVGLIKKEEAGKLVDELVKIYRDAEQGLVELDPGVEDIHSQVEMMLTQSLGDLGKRIHTGRSRNDQVMVDIKLFLRKELQEVVGAVNSLAQSLLSQAEQYGDILMPGYTHMQVAMPSSFGLWFGAYAEALADDLTFLKGVYTVVNQNPLGSAAGFGSSFQIDRELTTRLLAFDSLHIGSVNAQLNRGKTEWYVGSGISAIASTVARMAMDAVLFMGQNFSFLTLPGELTTGSSIMPHKKNPDVLELIRARCNRLVNTPSEISAVTTNLISGYHRDFQVLKEVIHPALADIKNCLNMMQYVIENVKVNENILDDETYLYLYSVEEVNSKVKAGMAFRDAYKEVAREIDSGRYRPGRDHGYTHMGSIGNPGTEQVKAKLSKAYEGFGFVDGEQVVEALKNYYGKS
ncbi:MAG: argininosuccinate lyase [Bacteroides sp.]|nr:argininosuccinate lyase [Bacteroides sp.]